MTFQEAIALQKATGAQNLITPENAGRILGLQAQEEARRQLALQQGRAAIEERKAQQAMEQGQTLETTSPERGRERFVFDAQGNVVGRSTFGTPQAQRAVTSLGMTPTGAMTPEESQLLRQSFQENLNAAVLADMARKDRASAAQTFGRAEAIAEAPAVALAPTPAPASVAPAVKTAAAAPAVSAPTKNAESFLAEAAKLSEQAATEKAKQEAAGNIKAATDEIQKIQAEFQSGKGKLSQAELKKLGEKLAKAKADLQVAGMPDTDIEALIGSYMNTPEKFVPKGVLPKLSFGTQALTTGLGDLFRSYIQQPIKEKIYGETEAQPTSEFAKFLLEQQKLRELGQ